ncbi:hypothetical protein [Flavobacterium ustbae]|uniref:hypothetical protein n=1 Tax=Flavobacterium ustbae TaxID=2488790 RepID=UPI000F768A32|nr:hypothetical protein [Flavobacterium ustbae]
MKNPDTSKNQPQRKGNPQNQGIDLKSNNPDTNPYDSENLDNESDNSSKDITEKDIEKDLLQNDPSEGFETDIDKPESGRDEDEAFETIDPDDGNPVRKEFEIGQLGSEELQQDELARDESEGGPAHFHKPSERKY